MFEASLGYKVRYYVKKTWGWEGEDHSDPTQVYCTSHKILCSLAVSGVLA